MPEFLSDADLDLIFRQARTFRNWADRPVSETLLQAVYDLARMGPTSANCSPARFHFVVTPAAKKRLMPALDPGNRRQTEAAPATVIVGYDTAFYDLLPRLYPVNASAKSWFDHDENAAHNTAFRNCSLQGAYLIMAARALGLDCGPMSGFDNARVDAEFFPDGRIKSNFLCNLGYGDPANQKPRFPRLDFDEACRIL
jgi:3-hydroxypropanoate dehydrogenase